MAWFSASLVVAYRLQDRLPTDPILVEEKFYLIEADCSDDARRKAEGIGATIFDDRIEIGGSPATQQFVGIRDIVSTQNLYGPSDERPQHGCELSYRQLELQSEGDLSALLCGSSVSVRFKKLE